MSGWLGAASMILGALAGTGVGAGGLYVLALTSLFGTEQIRAQWLNLVFFISSSATAVPYHLAVRKPDAGLILAFIALGVPGTLVGCAVRSALPVEVVRKIFGVMLVITGASVLRGKRSVSR